MKISLVIETNNIAGSDSSVGITLFARMTDSLYRLFERLKLQSWSIQQFESIVVTHHGLSAEQQSSIQQKSDLKIQFVQIPTGTGYYQAKNLGMQATQADIFVFADSDCTPDVDWLKYLLEPFYLDSTTQVTAGKTHYAKNVFGAAATTIDFMYFLNPKNNRNTLNFYANNVAFRSEVYTLFNYKIAQSFYRGNCQLLGLEMQKADVPIVYCPKATTTHAFPDTLRELVLLRLHRGQDLFELTPHLMSHHLGAWYKGIFKNQILGATAIWWIRLACSLRSLGRQGMPKLTPFEVPFTYLLVIAINCLDGVGTLSRFFGLTIVGDGKNNADSQSLSYHKI